MFYVYVLVSLKDGTTYIGFTSDLVDRLKKHNAGQTRSLKNRRPLRIVYFEEYLTKAEARKRELRLKNNSWEKEQLFRKIFPKKYLARSSRG